MRTPSLCQRTFEASKLPDDTTYLPVFVIEWISLLVRADRVLYSEYRSTEDSTRGTRSGAVLLITSDSIVTVDFKDVQDGVAAPARCPRSGHCARSPVRAPDEDRVGGRREPAVAAPEGRISEADIRGL